MSGINPATFTPLNTKENKSSLVLKRKNMAILGSVTLGVALLLLGTVVLQPSPKILNSKAAEAKKTGYVRYPVVETSETPTPTKTPDEVQVATESRVDVAISGSPELETALDQAVHDKPISIDTN